MIRIRPAATVVFVLLACALAWLFAVPLWMGDGLAHPFATVLIAAMMFTPAVAVVVVMLVMRPVPKGERLRFLGMWPLRPAKRVVWMMVLGLFAPLVLTAVSIAISALLGWVRLDLVEFSGFAEMLAASAPAGTPIVAPIVVILSQLIMIPIAAATINSVMAFGEELGWRGFLVPALRQYGTWPALLVSGAIWGLWHSPVILLGYNYGRADITGVLLMVGACIAWGILLGWLRLRSASLWPAVFAHGMMNAAGGMLIWFHAAGTQVDTALAGILGVGGWIACAIVVVVLALTGQFRRQPELAGAPGRMLSAPRSSAAEGRPAGEGEPTTRRRSSSADPRG